MRGVSACSTLDWLFACQGRLLLGLVLIYTLSQSSRRAGHVPMEPGSGQIFLILFSFAESYLEVDEALIHSSIVASISSTMCVLNRTIEDLSFFVLLLFFL